jgi:hypothetical protein
MRSHEGRGVLAIAKKVTLKQNLMVLGGLRSQIRIMPDYPLRRFLPDFGPRPSSWGLFFGAHRFPSAPRSPAPNPQPDADQTAPSDEALSCNSRFRTGRSGSSPGSSRKTRPSRRRDQRGRRTGGACWHTDPVDRIFSGIITVRFAPIVDPSACNEARGQSIGELVGRLSVRFGHFGGGRRRYATSGMRSIGESAYPATAIARISAYQGTRGTVRSKIDGVNAPLQRARTNFYVGKRRVNGARTARHRHLSLHLASGRSSPSVSSAGT